jgi:hypothetical protein
MVKKKEKKKNNNNIAGHGKTVYQTLANGGIRQKNFLTT